MKRRTFLYKGIAFSGMSLFFSNRLFAAANTKIDVIVDTSIINNSNINDAVEISDNRNLNVPSKPSSASSDIDQGKWVQWKPQVKKTPNNRGDQVSIDKIVKKGDPNGTSLLKGGNSHNGSNGVVKVDVRDDYVSDIWDYEIHITVKHGNDPEKSFIVDPKLRMIPPDSF
ncbi:MAG: hypothetical protein ACFHWX_14690 [Bacteroidota bacterium]